MDIKIDICRICLANHATKNICCSEKSKRNEKSLADILSFCLDIQVTEDSKDSTKLCIKCYKKVLRFNKFKVLAQKSDAYLKSLDKHEDNTVKDDEPVLLYNEMLDVNDKNESIIKEECVVLLNNNEINETNELVGETSNSSQRIKVEIEERRDMINGSFSEDINLEGFDSDDEVLSVIKKIKHEFVKEDPTQDQPTVKKVKVKKKKQETKGMCDECGKEVRDLKRHMAGRHHQSTYGAKKFKCNLCDKVYASKQSRLKHFSISHLGIKKHCNICNADVANIRYHIITHHKPEQLKFQCALCARKFICKSKYEEHLTLHTKDRPFECPDCGKRFRLKHLMLLHRRQVHEGERSHLCQFCSKSFFKKYHLQIHIRSHTKERPYKCAECGSCFSSTRILKNHQLTHSAEKSFQCSHCHLKFSRRGNLQSHLRTHSKEKPYPCQYCGVTFRRSDHRKRHEYTAHKKHMMIHTDNAMLTSR